MGHERHGDYPPCRSPPGRERHAGLDELTDGGAVVADGRSTTALAVDPGVELSLAGMCLACAKVLAGGTGIVLMTADGGRGAGGAVQFEPGHRESTGGPEGERIDGRPSASLAGRPGHKATND